MKKFITNLFLTILLWPLAIILLYFGLRKSFTKYPKRLGLTGVETIQCAIDRWIWKVDGFIPFGSSFWFIDRPKKVRPFDPEQYGKDIEEWNKELNRKLKEEYGIE